MKTVYRFALLFIFVGFLAVNVYGAKRSAEVAFVAISPDGSQLAAVIRIDERSLIYLVSSESGQAQRLTKSTDGDEITPSFSADGKQIAFVWLAHDAKNSQIRVVNADGSGLNRWQQVEGSPSTPVFTPDGKKIVFRSSGWFGHYSPIAAPRPHNWDYFIADLDGSNVKELTNKSFYDVSPPSVSPDGKVMIARTEDSHVGQYFTTYSLEDGRLLSSFRPQLPHKQDNDDPILNDPVFLPDGRKFLFLAADQSKSTFSYEVYLSEIGNSSVTQLTTRNGYAQGLTVSADGKKAAYLKTLFDFLGKPKETNIYLLDIPSRTSAPLTVTGFPDENARTR